MSGLFKMFLVCCLSAFVFAGCEQKKPAGEAGKGAAPAAKEAGKPSPEFLTAKLKCLKEDGVTAEDMDINVKAILQSLDRGDWAPVQLDAEAAKKYSLAWEYATDQGGGKLIAYTFGQSKDDPTVVTVYASAAIVSGARTPIPANGFYSKIKGMADQSKSFK
ncbi:MAG: hypothetical protein PHD54_16155 [Desulfuromonadaceae bacterium]|nr:hypothetical protein [Desulfuromonadaceae bacterium]